MATPLLIGMLGWGIAISVFGVPMWIASLGGVGCCCLAPASGPTTASAMARLMVLRVLLAAQGFLKPRLY